ncbi:lectin BRA-3-like [Crassostrea angulata]|uniref:lectin BRA-3-like n=1 Tax=Magallana angulata TaxID=2784310 RepID=UPI0022B09B7A|nr:lectin BRA-3-like [Crassostrea angulata]
MNCLSICFLLAFLSLFNCEQRGIYYSELIKNETISSLAMFYDDAATALLCGVKCFNDNCCAHFLYDKTSKKCLGLYSFEKSAISFSQIPGLSDKTEQYRKGCDFDWIEFKGHCYFYGQQQVTWPEAKLECQKKCSYLVEIEDKEESAWLALMFLDKSDCPTSLYKNCTAWTGGNDLDIEGKYVWDNSNTSFVFTNWYKFVPSHGDIRDCIDILKNGEWNDRPCSHLNHFICEK